MEAILTYNINVICNVKISYIKQPINNKEINSIIMPCPKSLVLNPYLVNQYAKKIPKW